MKRRVLWIAVAAVLAGPAAAGAEEKAMGKPRPPGPPAGSKWVAIPELTDEFEADKLDAAKWHDHNPGWKGRQPAFFARHNVKVSGGRLHLTMRKEDLKGLPKGYHTFTSAAVQSKAKVRYGYFEIKCRPMDSHGSSAFWFYDGTPEIWTEIDMFEMGAGAPKHEHIVHMNAHVFHTLVNPDRHWSRGGKWSPAWRLADGYHVYALEWDPDELKYSVDGAVVRTMANTHWHQPLTMNFDSETMPKWFGLPKAGDLPSTFSIDYVRSWRKAGGYGKAGYRTCEITFDAKEAAAAKAKTRSYAIDTGAAGRLLVVAKHSGRPRPDRVHLEYDDAAFFASQSAEKIEKTVGIKDKAGKALSLTFAWSKVKGYKKHGGYRADRVEVVPEARPRKGAALAYEFVSKAGKAVLLKLKY